MKLVWTKSSSPLSVLIRAITGDECSHFAFVFETAAKGLMFESNLLGTHPAFYLSSLKTHTVVHSLDVPMSIEVEDKVWDLIVQKYDGKKYDYLGALYLGWRKILLRWFKLAMPAKNAWSRSDSFYCDDLYDILNIAPGFPVLDVTGAMKTPHDVWQELKDWSPSGII